MTATIRLIEEIAINAWPAPQTLVYDGWVIRFAEGYTRRANSVNPLYPSTQNLEEKIEHCESLFGNKKLPTVFKLTEASEPKDLDELLAGRGYTAESFTGLQLLDLREWQGQADSEVALTETVTPEWFAGFWQASGARSTHEFAARQILGNIVASKQFATIHCEGQLAAFGLAVLQNGFVGLYDIVTVAAYHRRGLGRRVVQTLLHWAKQNGAHTAYLQVMLDNAPALALYAQLGFCANYQYWYRINAQNAT